MWLFVLQIPRIFNSFKLTKHLKYFLMELTETRPTWSRSSAMFGKGRFALLYPDCSELELEDNMGRSTMLPWMLTRQMHTTQLARIPRKTVKPVSKCWMWDVCGSACVGICRLLKYRWGVLAAVSQQDFGT